LKSRDAIREGIPIFEPLERRASPSCSLWTSVMIAVGEETGDIDRILTKIAEFQESEIDAIVKACTPIMEPVMIVVVGGIVVSMYLPMFKVFELVK
jgi:type IV pilus assembly protein PilC